MSSSDAQKSEVHAVTDDANTAPTSNAALGEAQSRPGAGADTRREGEEGAADESRVSDAPESGRERQALFPPGTDLRRDESDSGGPVRIDTTEVWEADDTASPAPEKARRGKE